MRAHLTFALACTYSLRSWRDEAAKPHALDVAGKDRGENSGMETSDGEFNTSKRTVSEGDGAEVAKGWHSDSIPCCITNMSQGGMFGRHQLSLLQFLETKDSPSSHPHSPRLSKIASIARLVNTHLHTKTGRNKHDVSRHHLLMTTKKA